MYKILASTVFLGKNLVFMPECHSTNTLAQQLCQETPPVADGTVVITSNQTAGRGQRGNTWHVEPGKNFTFSIILNTSFLAIQHQFYLNIFTSLAIKTYLRSKGCEGVSIKWPNDLHHKSSKIGGILVENQLSGNRFSSSVVGIGLNVNQRQFELESATSISLILDRELDLASELEILLHAIEIRYFQLRSGDLDGLMRDYLQALHWRNEVHTFSSKGQSFTGIIQGVDPAGRLVVQVDNKEQFFDVREISYDH